MNFEYVSLTIPKINTDNILNGAIRFIDDEIEVWVERKLDEYSNCLFSSFLNNEKITMLITRKNGCSVSCFDCLCTNTKINSSSFLQSTDGILNEPLFPTGYFRFKTNSWLEGAFAESKDDKVFASFYTEFEYLSGWLNTAPNDSSIVITTETGLNSEIARLSEIKFVSEGTGRIECRCSGDKISANDAAWNALYLQLLLRLLSGIAIPKAKITLLQANRNEPIYLHSHIGQSGIESGLNRNTIIPKLNLGISCEQLYSHPDIIKNWINYCSAKDISAISLISIGLNNTSINERILKLMQAFDALSFDINEVRQRFNKKDLQMWLKDFCNSLSIEDNPYGVTKEKIYDKFSDSYKKSLRQALLDFIGQNKKEIFEYSKEENYIDAVKYLTDYRNAISHGHQKDLVKLPEGFNWYKLFNLMYKVDLLLIKKYILKNDKLYLCENNNFRFLFERKKLK